MFKNSVNTGIKGKFPKNNRNESAEMHRLRYIYASYRIILTLIFVFIFFVNFNNPLIGGRLPTIYAVVTIGYFFVAIINYAFIRIYPETSNFQSFFALIIDVIAFSLMLYANQGPSIQMSMLFLVTVVASFILLTKKQAIVVTLFAIITVIYQQFIFSLSHDMDVRGLSNMTLLSLSFIGVALLSNMMTNRLKNVEIVAETKSTEVDRLNQLNQNIIDNMDNGVLIIDENQTILFINKAAQRILGLKFAQLQRTVADVDKPLYTSISQEILKSSSNYIFSPTSVSNIKEPLSLKLHYLDKSQTMVFIERVAKSQQQAQQLKLASLGRLTASIAHEIRNPVGAISQASQLLNEDLDPNNPDPNQPLYAIIHKQTKRVNQIIEDVLQLSRQQEVVMDKIFLDEFIQSFINEYFAEANIVSRITPKLYVNFSKNQFEQVLLNLVKNGFLHGGASGTNPEVTIVASYTDNQVMIDVIDNGDGVSHDNQQNLFEPFFTTAKTGTGLGLYLSRAFCEANGATLSYIPNHNGACFRISKVNTAI